MYIREEELRHTLFWGRLCTTKAGMVYVQNTQAALTHCTSAFHVILYVFYMEWPTVYFSVRLHDAQDIRN